MPVIDGNNFSNLLNGTDVDDTINGYGGNDTINGKGGNDALYGGVGSDLITGGDGNDSIYAGDGFDLVYGGDGDDLIKGGGDNDQLYGGDGADRFVIEDDGFLGINNTTVYGGSGKTDYDVLDLSGMTAQGYQVFTKVLNGENNGQPGFHGQITMFNPKTLEFANINFFDIEKIVPCFTPGSLIATPRGEVPVETLKVGDRVITRDNGIQEIRWTGTRAIGDAEMAEGRHLRPVLIRKGALGHGLPERDMMVSPNHRMLINNDKAALYFEEREVLVAAKHLTGMEGVERVAARATTYVHFMFDQHEVVLSDGSWTESFQPGRQALDGLGAAQRREIFELFPELATETGQDDYVAARRTLKKHEANLLTR